MSMFMFPFVVCFIKLTYVYMYLYSNLCMYAPFVALCVGTRQYCAQLEQVEGSGLFLMACITEHDCSPNCR